MTIISQYKNGDYTFTLLDNGTLIKEGEGKCAFPHSIDLKITDWCNAGCAYCFEDSTTKGKHGSTSFIKEVLDQLPGGQELALGGGDPLSHPDLDEILIHAKERGLISNITVNQFHLNQETIERIQSLSEKKLIWGIGISVNNVSTVPNLGSNTVYHLILGIHTPNQLDSLRERFNPCKVLLLGYKNNIGRGKTFYNQYVEGNIREWYRKLHGIFSIKDLTLCFDNLALSQLQVKRLFKEECWKSTYMGEDFTQSMYVDAVEEEYAPTSTNLDRVSARDKSLLEFFRS